LPEGYTRPTTFGGRNYRKNFTLFYPQPQFSSLPIPGGRQRNYRKLLALSFYPQALEKGLLSERALVMSLAEMYIQGVSTRKVAAIIKQLCDSNVSSSLVSRAAAQMDKQLTQWRNSPLREIVYLYLDARYEIVRQDGQVRDTAVLIAIGAGPEGHRKVLGVSASLGEQEAHWRTFMESLVKRGLRGVRLIISDDHAGLNATRKAVFGGVPWQRCQFHLQQNAQAYVPHKEMQLEVAEALRTVFNAPIDPRLNATWLKR